MGQTGSNTKPKITDGNRLASGTQYFTQVGLACRSNATGFALKKYVTLCKLLLLHTYKHPNLHRHMLPSRDGFICCVTEKKTTDESVRISEKARNVVIKLA